MTPNNITPPPHGHTHPQPGQQPGTATLPAASVTAPASLGGGHTAPSMTSLSLTLATFSQEETPCQRSVAELAGRFQGSAAQQDPAGHETVSSAFVSIKPEHRHVLKDLVSSKGDAHMCIYTSLFISYSLSV